MNCEMKTWSSRKVIITMVFIGRCVQIKEIFLVHVSLQMRQNLDGLVIEGVFPYTQVAVCINFRTMTELCHKLLQAN